jgi:hypothetical protein
MEERNPVESPPSPSPTTGFKEPAQSPGRLHISLWSIIRAAAIHAAQREALDSVSIASSRRNN